MPLESRPYSLAIERKISLIKIDAEGHEGQVLAGMSTILLRDRPILIVESGARTTRELLHSLGYVGTRDGDSPNLVFRCAS